MMFQTLNSTQVTKINVSNLYVVHIKCITTSHEAGKRQGRCGQCDGCKAPSCGKCIYCLDMPRFGGPGRKKRPVCITAVL